MLCEKCLRPSVNNIYHVSEMLYTVWVTFPDWSMVVRVTSLDTQLWL